jgi:hypothetical protein
VASALVGWKTLDVLQRLGAREDGHLPGAVESPLLVEAGTNPFAELVL